MRRRKYDFLPPSKTEVEKERPIFHGVYLSPYLTCKECNAFNVVNSALLHNVVDFVKKNACSTFAEAEGIPTCSRCHKTLDLSLGIQDYQKEITDGKETLVQYFRERHDAAILVQRTYRGWIGRCIADAQRQVVAAYNLKRYTAAQTIQSRVRGVMWRKTIKVKSALALIEGASGEVQQLVFQNLYPESAKPVFWFDSENELAVYDDYRQYVERSGNDPPLQAVEENIIEIATRVLAYENMMASRIQCTWRKILARQQLHHIAQCQGFLREVRVIAAITIQRYIQRRLVKKTILKAIQDKALSEIQSSYLQERRDESEKMKARDTAINIRKTYCDSRRKGYTLRQLGTISYDAEMRKYENSPYGSRSINPVLSEFASAKSAIASREYEKQQKARNRECFVLESCKSKPAFKHYFKTEVDQHAARMQELIQNPPLNKLATFKALNAKRLRRNRGSPLKLRPLAT